MQPLYILQGLICLNILFQLIVISFFNSAVCKIKLEK